VKEQKKKAFFSFLIHSSFLSFPDDGKACKKKKKNNCK